MIEKKSFFMSFKQKLFDSAAELEQDDCAKRSATLRVGPANNAMQGPQGPCTGNCAGPVRAARTGPVSIWPRAPKWPHMGLTARVSWRLNADFLHDVFWRCNADFLLGFHDGLMPISCTSFMVV